MSKPGLDSKHITLEFSKSFFFIHDTTQISNWSIKIYEDGVA